MSLTRRVLRASPRVLFAELFGLPLVALILLALALWGFGALVEDYLTGDPIIDFDQRFAATLHERASNPLTWTLKVITEFGGLVFLTLLTLGAVVVLWSRGPRQRASFLVAVYAGAQVLTLGLKNGFQRERPVFENPLATESTFSFPSGHALVSFAVYGALAYVIAGYLDTWRARVWTFVAAAALVLVIGFSRLYLGVHFLSDVLAGYCAGAAWLLVCIAALRLYEARKRARGERTVADVAAGV